MHDSRKDDVQPGRYGNCCRCLILTGSPSSSQASVKKKQKIVIGHFHHHTTTKSSSYSRPHIGIHRRLQFHSFSLLEPLFFPFYYLFRFLILVLFFSTRRQLPASGQPTTPEVSGRRQLQSITSTNKERGTARPPSADRRPSFSLSIVTPSFERQFSLS
jgi:hypothetical protein